MSRKNNENMETERAVIVRRFTDELQATTDLEKATQKAQIREDSDAEISEQERIQRSFNSVKGTTYET
jgi:ABC-type transport system involved in cytochrome bd biosynthesis fused ATPase/permease subunit